MTGSSAELLENAAKAGDFKYVNNHNSGFIDEVRKLIKDIESVLSAIDAENPKPVRAKPDTGILSKLLAAGESYDMDSADEAMENLEKYQYESGGELISWLRESIDQMNFKQMAEKLSGLLRKQ
jgi:hypothetical protein